MAMNFHNPGTCQFCQDPGSFACPPDDVLLMFPWAMHVAAKLTELEARVADLDRHVERRLGPTADAEDSAAVRNAKAVDAIMEDLRKRF